MSGGFDVNLIECEPYEVVGVITSWKGSLFAVRSFPESAVALQHVGIPVTLHIRTCRICRMVRAFDPSGLEVNSAESDSAIRYRHGESRAHMGSEFVAGLSWHRLIAASTSSNAPTIVP
jgi:hypothetical protein